MREMQPLIDGMFDGTLDDDERHELSQWIAADRANAAAYARQAVLHAAIRQAYTEQLAPLATFDSSTAPTESVLANAGRRVSRFVTRSAAIAAGIVIVGVVAAMYTLDSDRPSTIDADPQAAGAIAALADFSEDAIFADGGRRRGSALGPGPIQLQSGQAQIRFASAAMVKLTGPCEFEMTGPNRARLNAGTLRAFVPRQSAGFTIDVPGGRIVDLGTEFDVHVSGGGVVELYVAEGRVEFHRDAGPDDQPVQLTTRQALRVDARAGRVERIAIGALRMAVRGDGSGGGRVVDLLDIVAGGDGRGEAGNRGIEPHAGEPAIRPYHDFKTLGSGYVAVPWHAMIDGVFVPDGGAGPVRLNSAGATFDGFPDTANLFVSPIWSYRPRDTGHANEFWVYTAGRATQYYPEGRGLLALHANAGITFDLDAVRAAYPGVRIAAFKATAGNVQHTGLRSSPRPTAADIWVFVDGRPRFSKTRVNSADGVFAIQIELDDHDRFLTLAATDSSDMVHEDQTVFGDPVLQLVAPADAQSQEKAP